MKTLKRITLQTLFALATLAGPWAITGNPDWLIFGMGFWMIALFCYLFGCLASVAGTCGDGRGRMIELDGVIYGADNLTQEEYDSLLNANEEARLRR